MQAHTDSNYLFQRILKCDLEWPPNPESSMFGGLEDKSDHALLKLFQQGTREQRNRAFTALYNRYYLDVWRYTLRCVKRCEERARDVYAHVWVVGFEKLEEFEWPEEESRQNSPLLCWLWEIARRKALQEKRETARTIPLDAIEHILIKVALEQCSSTQPVSPEIQSEADQLLREALGTLKPIERRIINLVYYYPHKTSKEIGELLNKQSGTVRQIHKRSLPKLHKFLAQKEYPK